MIEIRNLSVPLDVGDSPNGTAMRKLVARQLSLPVDRISEVRLLKRSVDARRKANVHFVATVVAELEDTDEAEPH